MTVKERSAAMLAKELLLRIRWKLLAAPASCTFLSCRNFSGISANADSNTMWRQTSPQSPRPSMKPTPATSVGTCTGTNPERDPPRAPLTGISQFLVWLFDAQAVLQLLQCDSLGFRVEEQHNEELHRHHDREQNKRIRARRFRKLRERVGNEGIHDPV